MKRLQGAKYHRMKSKLIPYAYSMTKAGNICLYYVGGYYHYLNNTEKSSFKPDDLIEIERVMENESNRE